MRRGSALLIVLGLVSFLLVSAIAFSSYMRRARLPSSYLLRMSSSRNLVKAGLAEALDEIDRAIANNPHPGVGTYSSTTGGGTPMPNRNQWRDRVFLGTNTAVDVDATVSTLTLEGLAYVPAPLINEARYWSRRSPAAAWHQMGFDAGRFAFTAIDVSDYFDVNRMLAGTGRTSAEDSRVTLAYLFENDGHTGWRVRPSAWDDFMDNFLDDNPASGSKVPLVSVADLNLALWDKKPGNVLSPWCRFIDNGTPFVQEDERSALSNLVFVTDSWYPQPQSQQQNVQRANLANSAHQPFANMRLEEASSYQRRGFDELLQQLNNSTQFSWNGGTRKWADLLLPPVMAQLADYLDADSVPTSLALPCFERAPMITGVRLMSPQPFEIQVDAPAEVTSRTFVENNKTYCYKYRTYTVKLRGDLVAMVGSVYPFKHKHEARASYKVQAFASVTFVAGDTDRLRRNTQLWTMKPEWDMSAQTSPQICKFTSGGDKPSGCWMRSDLKTLTLPSKVTTEGEAVIADSDLTIGSFGGFELASELPASANGELPKQKCTLRTVRKVEMIKDPNGPGLIEGSSQDLPPEWGALPANNDLSDCVTPADGQGFVPAVQVWARIVDTQSDNAVVDLVPACKDDDRRPSEVLGEATGSCIRPALRFSDGAAKIEFANNELKGGTTAVLAPKGYLTDDPRFNYAPENFWVLTEEKTLKQAWEDLRATRSQPRDGDIFMATSDAGYLQSKYELAYLSRIAEFGANDDWGCLSGTAYDGKARAAGATLAADTAMWNTYTPYFIDTRRDDFASLEIVGGMGGARVCPYTPDTAVMMGALANTPFDWWAASTNDQAGATVKRQMLDDIDTALKYTFSDHAEDDSTSVRWEDLEALAQKLIVAFHVSQSVDGWKEIYDALDWDGLLFDDIETGSSVTLDSVDRKFLYGYWRDCFDARQQLFLVFVRAEPMMMGGGAAGATPPMLGGRAVALVWRSPTATQNNAPHQMRVLFYRQFD